MKEIIIPVCLAVFTIFIHWIGRIKAKADKADIETVFDEKIKVTMGPVDNKFKAIEAVQVDLKEAIASIQTNGKVSEEKFKSVLEAMDRHGEILEKFSEKMEKLIEKQDSKSRENMLLLFDKMEKLADKLATKADK